MNQKTYVNVPEIVYNSNISGDALRLYCQLSQAELPCPVAIFSQEWTDQDAFDKAYRELLRNFFANGSKFDCFSVVKPKKQKKQSIDNSFLKVISIQQIIKRLEEVEERVNRVERLEA